MTRCAHFPAIPGEKIYNSTQTPSKKNVTFSDTQSDSLWTLDQIDASKVKTTKMIDVSHSYAAFQGTYKDVEVYIKEWKSESILFKNEIVTLRFGIFLSVNFRRLMQIQNATEMITNFIGFSLSPRYIVTEMMNSSLEQLLAPGNMKYSDKLTIAYKSAQSIAFLHSNQFRHNNLSPSCIFVSGLNKVKKNFFFFHVVPGLESEVVRTWTFSS